MSTGSRWAVWCAYTLIVFAGVLRGGMWLDEMQVWCLGRDHTGPMDLLHGLRNEGHPPLWFLLVHGVSHVFRSPLAMGVLHGLFAVGTAWLILFRAPWPVAWRIAAVFGYYLVFEYAVIARNYGPAAFFLFAAAAAYRAGRPRLGTAALVALALTHYWGLVVASAWAITTLASPSAGRSERGRQVLVLAAVALAFGLAWPADPLPYRPGLAHVAWASVPDQLGAVLGQVFFPLPDLSQERPWNTSWLLAHHATVNTVFGVLAFVATIWCLVGDRRWLAFHLLAALGILAFPVLAPFRSMRYYGPLLMAFLAALWMAPPVLQQAKSRAILALLLLQVPGAVVLTIATQHMPRSMADRFVDRYRNGPLAGLPVLVHPDQVAPALSGYLGRPVFGLASGMDMSYFRWTEPRYRLDPVPLREALARTPWPKAVLVADGAGLDTLSDRYIRITEVDTLPGAQIRSEAYHVYLVVHRE